jgi:V8-like Glu-specific endopeptidase
MNRIATIATNICILIALVTIHLAAYSQQDTVIEYRYATQSITVVPPVFVDTTIMFDHTSAYVGPLQAQTTLSLTAPTANLFANTQFSDITRAELTMPVTEFPARTAIKIWRYNHDTLRHDCSGMLVSENFVLTAAHCVYDNAFSQWVGDSMLVAPAYDNGQFQPNFPSSKVKSAYLFKRHYDHAEYQDIALLELDVPVGQVTGYCGIAFHAYQTFFNGKIFHKFSYPGQVDPFDSSRVYNGDTMYYNYGAVEHQSPDWLVVAGLGAAGVPGQSGSTFLYTDNQDYYAYGVFAFASQYRHYAIDRGIFYQFKNVMDSHLAPIQTEIVLPYMEIFPHPVQQQATIRFSNPDHQPRTLHIVDVQGKTIREYSDITEDRIVFDRSSLPTGLYFVQLFEGKNLMGRGKLMVQ